MPRTSRERSATGYYHIIIRGINRQSIVIDDQDRIKLIDTLRRYFVAPDTALVAYCLMDNHLHLLIRAEGNIAMLIKKVASSYVYYYNHRYDRVGHLFQDRFRSEPIDTEAYLLTAARYILQNPLKAGISGVKEYPWSSWKDTETGAGLCDTRLLCECAGDRRALIEYCLTPNEDRCLDLREDKVLKDADALTILRRISRLTNPADIASLPKIARNAILAEAKKKGLSVRQISRLTGLDRNIIQRI